MPKQFKDGTNNGANYTEKKADLPKPSFQVDLPKPKK